MAGHIRLPFKPVDPCSVLGRIPTPGLKIIEEKFYLYIDISKWLDFRVFSDKDVRIAGTSDPLSIGQ
jgi:hypothetical protein